MTSEGISPRSCEILLSRLQLVFVEQKKEGKRKKSLEHCMKEKDSALRVWSVKRKDVLNSKVRLY